MKLLASQHFAFGQSLLHRGDFVGAVKAFRLTIKLDCDFPKAALRLSETLYMLGRYWEACVELSHVIKSAFRTPEEYILSAAALTKMNFPEYALEFLIEVKNFQHILNCSSRASLFFFLGETYRALGNNELAYESYEMASHSTTNSAWPFYYLGIIAKNIGEFHIAIAWFERSLACDGTNSLALIEHARTLSALGCREEARYAYCQLLTADNHHLLDSEIKSIQ